MSALAVLAQPDSRPVRLLVACACALATLGLAWEAARITWLLWPAPEAVVPPPRPLALNAPAATRPGTNASAIAAAHLFGRAGAEPVQARGAPVDAPATTLDLTLQGILYNSNPEHSRAIIQPGGQATEVLAVGADIAGATIDAIYPDRVILLRQGRHEALRLPEESLASAGPAASTATYTQEVAAAPPEDGLAALRERMLEDPTVLQQVLRPQPVQDDSGNLMGFRIQPGGDPDLLAATGLEPGDVVTEIGGIPLNSQAAAMEAMQRLGTAQRVTLTVQRDGQPRRLLLDFRN